MAMDMGLTILLLDIYKVTIRTSRSSKSFFFFFNQTHESCNYSDTHNILRSVQVITDSILVINFTSVKISTI